MTQVKQKRPNSSERAFSRELVKSRFFVNTTKTLYNMNIQKIRDLKQELEVALQKAFSDFHNKTGVGVRGVSLDHRTVWGVDQPQRTNYLASVTIELESL